MNILVFGASGKQGTSLLESLLSHDNFSTVGKVRCFCRHSNDQLQDVVSRSNNKFEVFEGNIANHENVRHALQDMDTVCLIQNPKEYADNVTEGASLEFEYGKRVIDQAISSNVQNFVLTSWAACCSAKEVPHFQSKGGLESYLRDNGKCNKSIVRPTWFMENLLFEEELSQPLRSQKKLCLPLSPNVKLPMCSIRDCGRAEADCCLDPQKLSHHNGVIEICSDIKTPQEMARILGCSFEQTSWNQFSDEAFQKMYQYLASEPIKPDQEFCKSCWSNMMTFENFASQTGLQQEKRGERIEGQTERGAGVSRT
ncbi:hypothetical protein GEMRC1_009428 [Eukaryota sp. GEM-RC1]